MKKKVFTMIFLLVGLLFPAINSFAQTTCADALTAVTGANQAPVGNELWYTFSTSGQPMAEYSVNYDSKSFDMSVTIYSGSCGNLEEISGNSIPAISGDENTYYIRFVWQGTPQAFDWELYQRLVVPVTGIEVSPQQINMQLDETYTISSNVTVNIFPANATNTYYDIESDNEDIISVSYTGYYNYTAKSTGEGTGKANIIFTTRDGGLKDSIQVTVSATGCESASTIQAGVTNTAHALQEQWYDFTPAISGIYQIIHGDVNNEGDKIGGSWTVYEGTCEDMRKCESVSIENYTRAPYQFESGKTYALRLQSYYSPAFEWTLQAPVRVTGFSLATKELNFDLSAQTQQSYELRDLGLNFTPADVTDTRVDIAVRDTSIIKLYNDGVGWVYKDAITPVKGGSTYIVFTTHDGSFKDSCLVTIKDIPVTSFSLSMEEATLFTPYNNMGESAGSEIPSRDTLNIESFGLNFVPENATDQSYRIIIRNKSIVQYRTDQGAKDCIRANHEGGTYVIVETVDGNFRDSVLVHVTRAINAGAPCNSAVPAQIGENAMPAAEYTTKWFTFTPAESGFYGMTNKTTKYPHTTMRVYEGACNELYLVNNGGLMGGYNESGVLIYYQFGFYGEAGKTYYIEAITQDFNTWGGEVIAPYVWVMHSLAASISGTVTDNGQAAEGKALLYCIGRGKETQLLQTVELVNGNYTFSNLGITDYYVKIITADGKITYYGDVAEWANAVAIYCNQSSAITGKDIQIIRKEALNEGSAKITGYITAIGGIPLKTIVLRSTQATGIPAENTTVLLQRDGNTIAYTQTNAAGYFEFTNIAVGDYTIVVDIPGMIMEETTAIRITENEQEVGLQYVISEESMITETGQATDIQQIETTNISLYPNPVKGTVYIEGVTNPDVKVYSIQGALVLQTNGNEVDLSKYAKGMYILQVGDSRMTVIKE